MTHFVLIINYNQEVTKMSKAERNIKQKPRVLKYYWEKGNVAKTCRNFEIAYIQMG